MTDDTKPRGWRRRIGDWIGRPLALCCLVAIGFSSTSYWASTYPLELLSHFQVQYFGASLLALVALVTVGRKWQIAIGGVAVLMSGSTLVQYSPLGRGGLTPTADVASTSGEGGLRVFLANVLTSNRRASGILEQIRVADPDIVVLQEVDEWWVDQCREELDAGWPFAIAEPRWDNFGLLVMSRLPLEDVEVFRAEPESLPSVIATVTLAGLPFRFVSTHPLPPMAAATQAERDQQLRDVADYVTASQGRLPLVLVGDLNATPWSPIHREFTDTLDVRNTRAGVGILPTWPADLPVLFRIPIDHVLAGEAFDVTGIRTGEPFGSDHLPLIVDLHWRETR